MRREDKHAKEKPIKYWGIFKGENLTAGEMDRVVEEETERLPEEKLKGG
ncbi:hypothetical protein [Thermococcus sp.]|nr:hypothetical protein [Thermococcus sp.]